MIRDIGGSLDRAGVRYALIGGFAMAMRGVQRATVDLDFILMLEDLDCAHRILRQAGYQRAFHSENVSHYVASQPGLGRIDLLHAFRGPSLSMLARAERLEIAEDVSLPGVRIPVVQVEDIIGLKIQALINDPRREVGDWQDIRLLLETAARMGRKLDWELIEDYLELFGLESEQERMKGWYGEID
ncbi:nucleotidyl transferase AbiEii/AbiGii toxin family protein [Thiorhodovibrio winogradskyi]|uniref:nucleotidyl transferase AbiEii/AbiGii toxin family protein n=1 Tax=Thiorhodovibrio winogradskyi TaxID=77007 RepID=UPI002E2D7740|nr:nucleotidyl transferase AbiEii/AbiGii toxin family protein [Thiorhodovibrio winogradskyi]